MEVLLVVVVSVFALIGFIAILAIPLGALIRVNRDVEGRLSAEQRRPFRERRLLWMALPVLGILAYALIFGATDSSLGILVSLIVIAVLVAVVEMAIRAGSD